MGVVVGREKIGGLRLGRGSSIKSGSFSGHTLDYYYFQDLMSVKWHKGEEAQKKALTGKCLFDINDIPGTRLHEPTAPLSRKL